jgi:hypothetical protein
MNNTAIVEIREIYGNKTIYPVNDTALYLARIAGTKTLTEQTIKHAKDLGFTFEIKQTTTI